MARAFGRAVAIASVALLLLSTSASAQITLGQLAPPNPPSICSGPAADVIQLTTSTGSNPYVVPVSGVVTSWSTNAGPGAGQVFKLKVFRPVIGTIYTVVGQDARPLVPSALNTFPTSIPVQQGDLIGLNDQNTSVVPNACLFETKSIADVYGAAVGDPPDGGTANLPPVISGYKANIAVTLKPPPTITGIAPVRGSIKGHTVVTLTGTDLGAATAVRFGTTPAIAYTVLSENQITVVAPPAKGIGRVPVSVSTIAGTSPATATFTYAACKVPRLIGKKLRGAGKRLRKAGCKFGRVIKTEGVTAKTGVVVKQNPKPGKILAPGAKVSVKLGR